MTNDVVVYLSSLHKQDPGRKVDTLTAFAEGAKAAGARVHIETKYVYRPSKLAVILGWPSPIQTTENIKLRARIVEEQKSSYLSLVVYYTFIAHFRANSNENGPACIFEQFH
jgi:hypothetical protein